MFTEQAIPIAQAITTTLSPWIMFALAFVIAVIHLHKAYCPFNGDILIHLPMGRKGKVINWAALALAYLSIAAIQTPLEVQQAVFRVVLFFFFVSEIIYNWGVIKILFNRTTVWISNRLT